MRTRSICEGDATLQRAYKRPTTSLDDVEVGAPETANRGGQAFAAQITTEKHSTMADGTNDGTKGRPATGDEIEHQSGVLEKIHYPEVSAGSGGTAAREGAQAKMVHNVSMRGHWLHWGRSRANLLPGRAICSPARDQDQAVEQGVAAPVLCVRTSRGETERKKC